MERRIFMQTLAASIAAGTISGAPLLAAGDSWKEQFAAALKKNPWLLGFKGTQNDFPESRLKVEGTLPPALKGTFYRNGPAKHEVGDMRYHHWFDGDGMMHAYHFDGQGVTHKGRFIETQKHIRENAAGEMLVPAFGTVPPNVQGLSGPDGANAANISVVKHNGELLALWEGGSAYRLDAETLDTLGIKTWSAQTAGLPFSAHPRIDADGTLWNFGYAPTVNSLVIYRISPTGQLMDIGAIPSPQTPMVHDFMITSKYLVLVLPPFEFGAATNGAFMDQFDWNTQDGTRVLVIDKNDLSSIREVQMPSFWVFHFANAHETADGIINFGAPIYDDPSIMTDTFKDIMRGQEKPFSVSQYTQFSINPATGKFDMTKMTDGFNTEFPRIDMRKTGQRQRYSFMMQAERPNFEPSLTEVSFGGGVFNTLTRLDEETGRTAHFTYGADELAEEHIFVPNPQSEAEGDGWMLGTTLNYAEGVSTLNVLDAQRLEDGPIARMKMDYAVPLGLHGNFYPA